MHSSRCFGWAGNVPTMFAPRPGNQRPVAKGAAVSSGLACRRNDVIVWSPNDPVPANMGAVLTLVHPGNANTLIAVAGPLARVYCPEDVTNVIVNSGADCNLWIEDPSSMTNEDT